MSPQRWSFSQHIFVLEPNLQAGSEEQVRGSRRRRRFLPPSFPFVDRGVGMVRWITGYVCARAYERQVDIALLPVPRPVVNPCRHVCNSFFFPFISGVV